MRFSSSSSPKIDLKRKAGPRLLRTRLVWIYLKYSHKYAKKQGSGGVSRKRFPGNKWFWIDFKLIAKRWCWNRDALTRFNITVETEEVYLRMILRNSNHRRKLKKFTRDAFAHFNIIVETIFEWINARSRGRSLQLFLLRIQKQFNLFPSRSRKYAA